MNEPSEAYEKSCSRLISAIKELKNNTENRTASEMAIRFSKLKLQATIINNDLARSWMDLSNYKSVNEGTDYPVFLVFSTLIHKMFEAKMWISNHGNPEIRKIAEYKKCREICDARLKEMKKIGWSKIDRFEKYRNSISGHYSPKLIDAFFDLEKESLTDFFEASTCIHKYLLEWLKLLRIIGKNNS